MMQGPRDYEAEDIDELDPDGKIFGGGFTEPNPPSVLGSSHPKTIVTWLLIGLLAFIALVKPLFKVQLPLPELVTDVLAPIAILLLLFSLVPRKRKQREYGDTGAQL